MTFQAPIDDIMFNVLHLSQWPEVSSLPRYDGIEHGDIRTALDAFGRFCSGVVAPLAQAGDVTGARLSEGRVVMPDGYGEAYQKFVETGWQSLSHPAQFGGMGMPRAAGAAATEIVNAADMSFGLCPLLTDGSIDALSVNGSPQQQALYLEKLISGRWTGTMNLTEPQAGSDLARIRTMATRREDGTYAVSGSKIFITYGEHDLSENIVHLVLARTPGAPAGARGLSLFVVPKFLPEPDGSPGARNAVACGSLEHKLGVRASPTAVLNYEGATGFLIGEENRGLEYMFVMMTSARFAVGIQGVAIAERATQQAFAYARERVQGRPVDGSTADSVPIIEHPETRRTLMRMRATVEGCRALAIATAGWLDLAENGEETSRNEARAMAEFLVPLVKGYCTESAVDVASMAVQVHGGMGFIEETGVARLYRDARILPIYEGTTAIQANDLLGRKVQRDGGAAARRFAGMVVDTARALSMGDAQSQSVAAQLDLARAQFEASLNHLLATLGGDVNAAYAGSVPFLMLTGNLAAGWQLGRAMLAAKAALARDEAPEFMANKCATASFYAHNILVQCAVDRACITEGAPSLRDATL